MNIKLQQLFDLLESERNALLSELTLHDQQKLRLNSPSGGWSVQQIIAHLITSERLSIGYMKKKSLGITSLDDSGIVEEIKMVILKLSQRLPLKFKAPNVVVELTPEDQTLEQLKIQWDELRKELKSFLETIADQNVRKKIYKHPVAGRLDCAQALSFFREHFYHHYPQIKRHL